VSCQPPTIAATIVRLRAMPHQLTLREVVSAFDALLENNRGRQRDEQ
jgi:hypothetical protein